MKADRQLILKIAAAGVVALFVMDKVVIEPAYASWGEQSDRITTLRAQVANGDKLVAREQALRDHWADMMRANLPTEVSAAENVAFDAILRWTSASQLPFTSLAKQWGQPRDDGSVSLEFKISATGDQASIGRFLYEMETDHVPVNMESCEIDAHDAHGSQLLLTATFSFLRLPEPDKKKP